MKFKTLLIGTIGSLALSAFAQQKVEITFRQIDPPGEISALTQAVEKWNAANPNIQVRLQSIAGNEALNAYTREAQAGGGPDVAQLGFAWIPDLSRANLLLNLTTFMTETPVGKGIPDLLASDLNVNEGKVNAVPWTADTFAFAYRPDFLQKAGLSEFPRSWPALAAAAKKLSADTNNDGRTDQYGLCFSGGAGLNSSTWFMTNYYLWSNGWTLVEKGADGKWKVGISEANLASAMTYFNDFFASGSTPRSNVALTLFSDPELTGGLGRGDCAMGFFPPQTFRAAQAASKVPLKSAIVPVGLKARTSHLGGRSLGINPNSKYPKEAWAFVRYLTSAEVMKSLPQYPAQRTLLRSIKFPENESGFVEMLPRAVTFRRYTDSPVPLAALAETTTREYSAVFSGQKTAKQAAADMIAAINTRLANK